jgi:hypothetical protein
MEIGTVLSAKCDDGEGEATVDLNSKTGCITIPYGADSAVKALNYKLIGLSWSGIYLLNYAVQMRSAMNLD